LRACFIFVLIIICSSFVAKPQEEKKNDEPEETPESESIPLNYELVRDVIAAIEKQGETCVQLHVLTLHILGLQSEGLYRVSANALETKQTCKAFADYPSELN
jgi:hypothetical protein